MLSGMDAAQALADLTEISSQVAQVAILDQRRQAARRDGDDDDARAERFVEAVAPAPRRGRAARARRAGLPELSQLEVSTLDGSVFAVRRDGRLIVATTRPDPTVGLDLLRPQALPRRDRRRAAEAQAEPARRTARASRCRAGRATAQKGGHLCVSRSPSLVLVAGALAGTVLYRRRSARRIERVELYAADGSMVSLPDGSLEAERMLDLAREVLSLPG